MSTLFHQNTHNQTGRDRALQVLTAIAILLPTAAGTVKARPGTASIGSKSIVTYQTPSEGANAVADEQYARGLGGLLKHRFSRVPVRTMTIPRRMIPLLERSRRVKSVVIAALDFILEHGDDLDIRVVNMSLGKAVETPAAEDPLVQAVEALWDAG